MSMATSKMIQPSGLMEPRYDEKQSGTLGGIEYYTVVVYEYAGDV
jgi:hypothetical protein